MAEYTRAKVTITFDTLRPGPATLRGEDIAKLLDLDKLATDLARVGACISPAQVMITSEVIDV